MLDKELEYFAQHRDEFVREHSGEFVVIVGNEILGFYPSEIDAYSNAMSNHELGTFLIRRCVPESEQPTATFYSSRVSFA